MRKLKLKMKQNKTKTKHVPMRMCIATGEKKPKSELIRFVRTPEGEIQVDPRSKLKGRGANLTMTEEAFNLAIKKKAFQRALKLEQGLSEEDIKRLRTEFLEAIAEKQFRPHNKPVTIKVKKEDLKSISD